MTPSGDLTLSVSMATTKAAHPRAGLVQGSDGNFYGTTYEDDEPRLETVFRMTPSGSLTILASFANANGAHLQTGLIQGRDGNFYGTAADGGLSRSGTIFRVTPDGVLTTVVSFANTNGANPSGALIHGSDGYLYGTTAYGGPGGGGTVFRTVPPTTVSIARSPNKAAQLSFSALSNFTYRLEASTNLADWLSLTNLANSSGTIIVTDREATNCPARFYRAISN